MDKKPTYEELEKELIEYKRTEDSLNDSEYKFQNLANSIDDIFFALDNDLNYTYFNDACSRLLGKSSEFVVGKSYFDLEFNKNFEWAADIYKEVMSSGQVRNFESSFELDNKEIWCDVKAYPSFLGCTVLIKDITERKQAEESLETMNKLLIKQKKETIERVKELQALYALSEINERENLTIEELYQEFVNVIPDSWQYPDITCANIIIDGNVFSTGNCKDCEDVISKLSADIKFHKNVIGSINVCYLEEKSEKSEGPFLKEERMLIDSIAERLGRITERKQAEKALSEDKEKLQYIFKNSRDVNYKLDFASGTYEYLSPNTKEIMGYSSKEFKTWGVKGKIALFHPDDLERLDNHLSKLIGNMVTGEEKIEYIIEYRFKHGELGYRWMSDNSTVIFDEDNNPISIVGSIRDITDRKIAETALQKSEEKHRSLFESMVQGVVYQDAEGKIISANPAAEKILGLSIDQMKGRTSMDPRWKTIHEDGSDFPGETHPGMVSMETGEEVKNVIMGVFHPTDGTYHWININAIPQFLPGEKKPYQNFATFDDITERRKAEEEKAKLQTKIQEAQKLESLGVLTGGIAHDFNNLLTAILGNSELALLKMRIESPVRESVEEIKTATLRAAELTRQMLAYSGKGKFIVEAININSLIEEMWHMLEVSISKKSILKRIYEESIPAVSADATQISQIIMNLIINASEAIGGKSGTITISTGLIDTSSDNFSILNIDAEINEGYYVFIEVSDTGCGMDDETIRKLFDPFFTTKVTGRGLGLSAVQGIVYGHKGAIKIDSEPGKGTTIKIFLPCQDLSLTAIEKTKDSELSGLKAKGTALVVDDEDSARTYACMVLEKLGFDVISAEDGREGVEVFSKHKDEISLVLLDMTMPHMDGKEAFSAMKQIKPDVSVILISGYNEQEATSSFVGKGLAGFVQKPFQISTLVTKLLPIFN